MILAAGRGERMRPLSDATPKPLLEAGGKPLIVWQIEALARAGFRDIVVNVSHLADRIVPRRWATAPISITLRWSIDQPLEVAGGIATAFILRAGADRLRRRLHRIRLRVVAPSAKAMVGNAPRSRAHLVLVPNSPYHPGGDFALVEGRLALEQNPRYTYANIGLYDTELFRELPRGTKLKLLPYLQRWIADGRVSGETFAGAWANVGTPDDLAHLDVSLRQGIASRRAMVQSNELRMNLAK